VSSSDCVQGCTAVEIAPLSNFDERRFVSVSLIAGTRASRPRDATAALTGVRRICMCSASDDMDRRDQRLDDHPTERRPPITTDVMIDYRSIGLGASLREISSDERCVMRE